MCVCVCVCVSVGDNIHDVISDDSHGKNSCHANKKVLAVKLLFL